MCMSEKNEEKKYPDSGKREIIEGKEYSGQITKANIASGVVIKKDNKYLLVQENIGKIKGLWNLPAGKVEKGLTFAENAKKEAKEETGYDVKIIKEIGIFQKDGESVRHAFEAEIISGELKFPKEEIADVKWFTMEEIKKIKDKLRSDWVLGAIELMEEQRNINAYLDSWKRCQADFDNYKKDQAKQREEFRKYVQMDVILQLLPVLDNFEISLAHVPEEKKGNGWVEGIVHIKRQIEDVLRNNGIEEIVVKSGDKFDPEIHEAIGGEGKKQVVKKVLRKGYKLDGRIVRAARVEVG